MNTISQSTGSMEELEKNIGYSFKDKQLLKQAMTHSSYANEHRDKHGADYERLEFLGDAVLELVASRRLYMDYPSYSEGELTRKRAAMVCEEALAPVARSLDIPRFIILGKGEEATGGRDKPSILCDIIESITGAIYLDGGLKNARQFLEEKVIKHVEIQPPVKDAKTSYQEMIQSDGAHVITYSILGEEGPDHMKTFQAAVYVDGVEKGRGTGHSKKLAEQAAAAAALSGGNK